MLEGLIYLDEGYSWRLFVKLFIFNCYLLFFNMYTFCLRQEEVSIAEVFNEEAVYVLVLDY